MGSGKHWDVNMGSGDSQDLDFVTGIITWVSANYNCRASHVFTTGHSYGAYFSYYAAVHLCDDIAAFGEHSGGLVSNVWPTAVPTGDPKVSGILLHSTGDGVVPYASSQNLHAGLQSNGHISVFITLAVGLGHNWDKSYNQTQWDFLMSHAPVIDDDADGMPDWWEDAHGLDSTTNDAAVDKDEDGASNLDEYTADTDPTNVLDVLKIGITLDGAGPGDVITFWQSSSSRAYTLWSTTNLPDTNAWAGLPGFIDTNGTGGVMSHTNTTPIETEFYRISVSVP
jgi:poly(3-hydroxybutyrate) depolymerase